MFRFLPSVPPIAFRASRAGQVLRVCALLGAAVGSADAQGTGTIRGTVTNSNGTPVSGARVRVSSPATVTPVESDESGAFSLARLPVGETWVLVRRIGFRPDSVRVQVSAGNTVQVPLALQPVAVALDVVRITGRRDVTGHLAGFYRRMDIGNGRFFTGAELERRNAIHMTDVFRMVPGLRIETRGFQNSVRMRGSRCAPLVWLDGQPLYAGEVDLDAFDPRSFDGIEIYSGPSSVPVEFQGNQRMSSACGTIVLWSKRGELREKRRKRGAPTPTEQVRQMVEQREAYLEADVDAPARPDSAQIVRPVYPDSLFEAMAAGRVVAEFVVGTNGEPNMETFSAVTATHRLFVEPVRRAVREQRFVPAVRRGRPVSQVLHLPFEFLPDSTARRRR